MFLPNWALAVSIFVAGCTRHETLSLSDAEKGNPAQLSRAAASATANATSNETPALTSIGASSTLVAGETSTVAEAAPVAAGTLRLNGSVTAGRFGSVSFKVAGHIKEMGFRPGDRVKKGQVLAMLDDADAQLRARLAAVALNQAKVGLEQARRDLTREDRLKKENASTQIAFERSSNALESAQLAYSQAQINQDQTAKAVADTKLAAPYDGVISKQFRYDGEYVAVGAQVYELFDVNQIEVTLKIPENLLSRVKKNQVFEMFVPSLGQKTKANITRVVPIVNESTRTFDVIAKPQDNGLFPGQYIEAEF